MRMTKFKTHIQTLLPVLTLVCAVLSTQVTAQGAAAGKVVFAMGTPQAIDSAGASRTLSRGDEIFAGDRLVTGRGRLQVNMADGAFISVQPNSEYVLDNYNYSGQPDGTEQAVYRLVKGGVRAVTGLIGRTNKEAYKVNTAVATIGIRGTGHNTRICSGDCGSGVRDGLYHNTWEGVTYVVNDVDSEDVPAGNGVYVEDIDTPILPLDQPPGITAVATRSAETDQEEEETRDVEDQTTVVSTGEQRTETGERVAIDILSPTESTVTSAQGALAIIPDEAQTELYDIFRFNNAAVLQDTDGNVIGFLGLDTDSNANRVPTLGTINLNAALGADDPLIAEQVANLIQVIAEDRLQLFLENPAEVVEDTQVRGLGFGRWANGSVLGVNESGEFKIFELADFQSFHYIYGDEVTSLPVSGTAVYDFVGGTQSTSISGATIGSGAVDGGILVDFGTSTGQLRMEVGHDGRIYFVNGPFTIDTADVAILGAGVLARTNAAGSACNPSCSTFLDGKFLGGDINGIAEFIGLEYEIQETDVIIGVAGFATDNIFSTATTGLSTFAYPFPSAVPGVAFGTHNSASGYNVYLVSDSSADFIGEIVDDTIGNVTFINTINPGGLLDNNNPTVVSLARNILSTIDPLVLSTFNSNPAGIAESFTAGDVKLGRWANGHILFADDIGFSFTEELTGEQSYHFINGPDPGPLPSGGGAFYNFTAATQSTTASGLPNLSGVATGSGVIDGSIFVDFFSGNGTLEMDVSHGNLYQVTGPLIVDSLNNTLFDGGSTGAATSAPGSACNPVCTTYFFGSLIGPNDAGGLPQNLGIYYEILEHDAGNAFPDPIMGVAAFNNTDGFLKSFVETNSIFISVQPDLTDPLEGAVTAGSNAAIHFDYNSGEVIGAIFTDFEDDLLNPPNEIQLRIIGTIDLDAMKLSDDLNARAELDTLVSSADPVLIADFESNPASVVEFFDNGEIGFGRWANGKILSISDAGDTEVDTLTGNQSLHFIFGKEPGPITSNLTSAIYNFSGGTRSTSESGASIGNGVISGSIDVNFGAGSANLSMIVDHINVDNAGGTYTVFGPLNVVAADNEIFDSGAVLATGGSGACLSSCNVIIDGGFAGPEITPGMPTNIGIEYEIQENDLITGVAGFTYP